ncbi:MAG: hypothetical protein ACSW8J_00920 [bacterium]
MKTSREIGFFETNVNLSTVLHSDAIRSEAGAIMPLPDANLAARIQDIAEWIVSFGKRKYLFMTPEIALIDALAALRPDQTAMILSPCDLSEDVRTRMRHNLPKRMKTFILEEPFFPEAFYPANGLIVACGYLAGGRAMVLPETYRMIDHYMTGFYGKKVFIPYTALAEGTRYGGWLEVSADKFSGIWRDAE